MTKKPSVSLVILAAGAASRMGKIKQLLPWENTTLLGHAIKQGLGSKVTLTSVVLGANHDQILSGEDFSEVEFFINAAWENGIGCSIAYGMRQLLESSKPDAVIVTLADQPLVSSEYIDRLIDKFYKSQKSIIATAYKGSPGVPALFAKKYFNDIMSLTGDTGAKKLMLRNKDDIDTLDGSKIIQDIDTIKDYLASIEAMQ